MPPGLDISIKRGLAIVPRSNIVPNTKGRTSHESRNSMLLSMSRCGRVGNQGRGTDRNTPVTKKR